MALSLLAALSLSLAACTDEDEGEPVDQRPSSTVLVPVPSASAVPVPSTSVSTKVVPSASVSTKVSVSASAVPPVGPDPDDSNDPDNTPEPDDVEPGMPKH